VPAFLAAGLGAAAGSVNLASFYHVIGAGLAGSLYWTVAGGLVGLFVGASVGARAAPRMVGGPLHAMLFGGKSLPLGKDLALAVGLLVGVSGLLLGACVGMVAGGIFGAIPALAVGDAKHPGFESILADGLLLWAVGGAVVGLTLAIILNSRLVSLMEWYLARPETSPIGRARRLLPVFIVLGGAAGGAALGAAIWALNIDTGGVIYWALAGGVTGATTASKLWSVAEK
jgi:hypothetical protein